MNKLKHSLELLLSNFRSTYVIYPDVLLGKDSAIGDYCVIGQPGRNPQDPVETRIGDNAQIRSHTVIYAGNMIGHNFQTGHHVMLRELNTIGHDVSIGTGAVIEHHVTIGDRARMHSNVFIPEFSVLEDDCWIGPNVVLTNARYPKSPDAKQNLKGVCVRKFAKIGANSTILPGITIGEGSLVGAGAVVTHDVPAWQVVAGNPARVLRNISDLPYEIKES
ncbi:MAG: transferase [SAR324 cluster bacterium]|nr:transferase [SAR324 cluster bacterium]